MPYSETTDLLTGQIPLPRALDPQKFVDDAGDEIDGALGQIYVTPIEIADAPEFRPSKLILKRISNLLASGRLIMAADSGGQDRTLHAYGVSLVREAQAALAELRTYSDSLPGAELIPGGENADDAAGLPRILNLDPHSHVEAFYDYFNPVLNPLRPVVGPGPTRWP